MTTATGLRPAYIIAARRTALGRPGGLHRGRRLEELAPPVIEAALKDARIEAGTVEGTILGNTTAGSNPARVVGLASGLGDGASALTVDRHTVSGLDAILLAARAIMLGEADVLVAGGAESISTAPWRVAKPKSLFQTPRFIDLERADVPPEDELSPSAEELARRMGITREQQDGYVLLSHLRAEKAQAQRVFSGEIHPLKMAGPEARDESGPAPDADELAELPPLFPPAGTLTEGNTSAVSEGAAFAVVVCSQVRTDLGAARALRLVASAETGVPPADEERAPMAAIEKLFDRGGFSRRELGLVEMSESSAVQALALGKALDLEDGQLSPDGGALVRGRPLGASGAVSVVRLFTRMVRVAERARPQYGAVAQGAAGGLGVAALFEAV